MKPLPRLLWAVWVAAHSGVGAASAGIHCRVCGREMASHAPWCPVRIVFVNRFVGPYMNRAHKEAHP